MQQQNYSFWKYAAFPGLVFHLLFVTPRPIQIRYPQKQLEVTINRCRKHSLLSVWFFFQAQNRMRTNQTTIETMLNDIQPQIRQYLVRDNLILDILPYMLEILQPRLRQVRRSLIMIDRNFFKISSCSFRRTSPCLRIKNSEIFER